MSAYTSTSTYRENIKYDGGGVADVAEYRSANLYRQNIKYDGSVATDVTQYRSANLYRQNIKYDGAAATDVAQYRSENPYRQNIRYNGGFSVVATPAAIAGSATLGAAIPVDVTVAPAAVAGSATVDATGGVAATVTPAAIAGSAAVSASVTLVAPGTAEPAAIAGSAAVSAVASGTTVVAPAAINGAATIPTPTVVASGDATPSAISGAATIPTPTVVVNGDSAPAAITGSASLGVAASGDANTTVSVSPTTSIPGADGVITETYFQYLNPAGPTSRPNRTSKKWGQLNVAVHPGSGTELTVIKKDGVYTTHVIPTVDDIVTADQVFQGGRVNTVTANDKDAIEAAGIGGEFVLIG